MLEDAAGEAAAVWGRWAAKGAFLSPRVRAAEGAMLGAGRDATGSGSASGSGSDQAELLIRSPSTSRHPHCTTVAAGTSQPPGNATISAVSPSTWSSTGHCAMRCVAERAASSLLERRDRIDAARGGRRGGIGRGSREVIVLAQPAT